MIIPLSPFTLVLIKIMEAGDQEEVQPVQPAQAALAVQRGWVNLGESKLRRENRIHIRPGSTLFLPVYQRTEEILQPWRATPCVVIRRNYKFKTKSVFYRDGVGKKKYISRRQTQYIVLHWSTMIDLTEIMRQSWTTAIY